jgi:hypothetical protein
MKRSWLGALLELVVAARVYDIQIPRAGARLPLQNYEDGQA